MENDKSFEVMGEQTGDYFKIYCSECGSILETKFLGYDPSIALFNFTCPTCKISNKLKISKFEIK